jgi:hypothetical protein
MLMGQIVRNHPCVPKAICLFLQLPHVEITNQPFEFTGTIHLFSHTKAPAPNAVEPHSAPSAEVAAAARGIAWSPPKQIA